MTTDQWVAAVNKMGREMDDLVASLHPSAWPEALAPHRERFRKLAATETAPTPTRAPGREETTHA